ncbi:hypothetical protein A7U58_08530 [Burkholderia pseudomallei]|nr:hypothetical protein A7U58_08530 [Burkholderia pseudomallei]ANW56118.1 hypothetical protein A7U59_08515 [Burkholderia pseudomallei]
MLDGEAIVTDSRIVAAHFGKQHKNVLRDAYALRDSEKPEIRTYYRLNFEPVEDHDAKGELRVLFRMTKNGFMLLTMGFTGEKALLVKIAFVDAFDAMAEYNEDTKFNFEFCAEPRAARQAAQQRATRHLRDSR